MHAAAQRRYVRLQHHDHAEQTNYACGIHTHDVAAEK